MRIWGGRALLLVGGFLLVAAAVAGFWGAGAAERVPLDTESFTRLTGTASGSLAKSDTEVPVDYITHTWVDEDASTGKVVVLNQLGCITVATEELPDCIDEKGDITLDADDERIVQIMPKQFAIDRHDATAVADQGEFVEEELVAPYVGLVTKFPFNVKKKTYPFWDGTLGKTVDATYQGTRDIDGLETYEFQVEVPEQTAEVSDGIEGQYEATQTIWADPKTGAYVDQTGSQRVSLPDGTLLLDIDVTYTEDTVKTNVEDAKSNHAMLTLIEKVIPIGGLVGGLACLALGGFLTLGGRRGRRTA
ncbi:DUF3068 domain-containing protein [Nocardioides sp.]|uniref:DUF3068 domain-containing protein n=1 Tax=Nocardioides sp. TaxID=35761 RepID=UPI0039E5EA97